MPHWVTTRFDDSMIDPAHAFGSVRLPDRPEVEFVSTPVWHCRYCAMKFDTATRCRQHEQTLHKTSSVPFMRVAGRVLNSAPERFLRPIARENIEIFNTENIALNGQAVTKEQLLDAITSRISSRLCIGLSNEAVESNYQIDLEFMNENALHQIDLAFIQNDWNQPLDRAIDRFEELTAAYNDAAQYREALVKYLVALKLKNAGNPTQLTHFNDKFDSAYATLSQVHRPLAVAILQVIRFNQNHLTTKDTFRIPATFYPMVQFFYGEAHESESPELSGREFTLPIDQTSKELLKLFSTWPQLTTEELMEKRALLPWLRTEHDKRKYDYLVFRKALAEQKFQISNCYKRQFPTSRFN